MEENKNIYIGQRYVPKMMGEWNKQETYEGLSVVTYQGASYTSKKHVPAGIDILADDYWVVTGNYNEQVETYRQDVKNVQTEFNLYKEEFNESKLENESNFKKLIDVDVTDFLTSEKDVDNIQGFISLINHINQIGGYCNVNFPKAEYTIGVGNVPAITVNEVNFIGSGFDQTRLILSDTTYWTWGNTTQLSSGGGIRNMTLQYRGATTNVNHPTVKAYHCTRQTYNIKYWIGCTFLEVGSAGTKGYAQTIENSEILMANKGKPFIKLINGAGLTWNTFDHISHVEASTPAWGTSSVMNTVAGTNAIDIVGAWDTIELKIFAEKLYRVINIDNPSGVIYNIKDEASVYDYIRDNAVHINLETSGAVVSVFLNGTYITTWEGHGVYGYSNSKDLRWLSLTNVNILYTGKSGVSIDGVGQSIRRFSIQNCKIRGTGRLDGSHAVRLGKYLIGFQITGNQIGGADLPSNITWGVGTGLVTIGEHIDTLWKDYIITNNNCEVCNFSVGAGFIPIIENIKNGIIKNNTNANYKGFKNVQPFLRPASSVKWYNVTPFDVEVYIGGSSVTEITKNGQSLPFTEGVLLLNPKDNYSITYADTIDLSVHYNVTN